MGYSETRFDYGVDTNWLKAGAAAAVGLAALVYSATSTTHLSSAHVLLQVVGGGHGSATHIGDGLYVTAAHVVEQGAVTINGKSAELLWANDDYDVALVRGPNGPASVPLACYVPRVGEIATAHGNPMDFKDITTTLRIAGEPRQWQVWKLVLPTDGTIGPGMSGGGVVIGGALVGVNVGASLAPVGFGGSFYGITVVVPSSVVCSLMGRT